MASPDELINKTENQIYHKILFSPLFTATLLKLMSLWYLPHVAGGFTPVAQSGKAYINLGPNLQPVEGGVAG